jgi:homoserine kinase type II
MAAAGQADQLIYWAYHWYDEDERTLKTIGYFSNEEKAKAAIDSVKSQPGFRDHPDGFEINRCRLDQVCWSEGFASG